MNAKNVVRNFVFHAEKHIKIYVTTVLSPKEEKEVNHKILSQACFA
jgi:hypothetical protein